MIERIEINLLPAAYRVHKKTISLRRGTVYPFLGVLLAWVFILIATMNMDGQINQLKGDIRSTEYSISKNKSIKEEIAKLKENNATVQGKILALQRINVDRAKWVRIMESLCQRLPDFTWLISCEEKDSSLIIEGRTYSFPEVANFMTRLAQSDCIKSVDLSGIEEKDDSKTFAFSVTCRLKSLIVNNPAAPDSASAAGKRKEGSAHGR